MIEKLKDKLSSYVDIENELVSIAYEQSKDIKEFVATILENMDNQIKSPTMATNYLRKFDPTFKTAIKLTLESGYNPSELDSELMATVHNKNRLSKALNAHLKHLNNEFLGSKKEVTND